MPRTDRPDDVARPPLLVLADDQRPVDLAIHALLGVVDSRVTAERSRVAPLRYQWADAWDAGSRSGPAPLLAEVDVLVAPPPQDDLASWMQAVLPVAGSACGVVLLVAATQALNAREREFARIIIDRTQRPFACLVVGMPPDATDADYATLDARVRRFADQLAPGSSVFWSPGPSGRAFDPLALLDALRGAALVAPDPGGVPERRAEEMRPPGTMDVAAIALPAGPWRACSDCGNWHRAARCDTCGGTLAVPAGATATASMHVVVSCASGGAVTVIAPRMPWLGQAPDLLRELAETRARAEALQERPAARAARLEACVQRYVQGCVPPPLASHARVRVVVREVAP
jgi:hypothetical protein